MGAGEEAGLDPAPRLRFPRARRVLLARDFQRVRERGWTVRDGVLRLGLFQREDGAPARLGLAVSRRNGDAVRRNRIKRVLREAFRLQPGRFPDGLDVVVIPMDARRSADFAEVVGSLDRLAERVRSGPQRPRTAP